MSTLDRDIPMITMFMGQNVDEMSREEAIEALKMAARLLTSAHETHRSTIDFHRSLRERRIAA